MQKNISLIYPPKQQRNRKYLFAALLCLFCSSLFAQSNDPLRKARQYLDNKDYPKAAEAYKNLSEMPEYTDANDVYNEYLLLLLKLKNTKDAEALVKSKLKRPGNEMRSNSPLYLIDLGNVYKAAGKPKKAEEEFEAALKYINGDDILTQQMANAFVNTGNEEYAIKTYERAHIVMQNPYIYNGPLAKLYSRTGQVEKAINAAINTEPNTMPVRGEPTVEASLLEITGKDKEKIRLAQKTIIKQINARPDNFYYTNLLIWIFSIQDDWDQAYTQVQALERRSSDKGKLYMDFATSALKQGKYDMALKAYDAVIGYGTNNARYMSARELRLSTLLQKLQNNPAYTSTDISFLEKEYDQFLKDFPTYGLGRTINDYALLEAQYAGNTKKAIALLKNAIEQPGAGKLFTGNSKLQLGDYYTIDNQVWEAALVYSQVDKAFREDMLGEEARFRNAKLSYYRGDFEMAQGQLSVLKASTSELIANDALYLSVLITENVPPDSNLVPLKRFAYADLLLFQNKTNEATALLDSIGNAFPKHPLNDDILMLHAKIAQKHREYNKAIDYMKKVVEQYGKDVLADDAIFRIAQLYEQVLNNKDEARKYYEQLIIDYPGSTYIQAARDHLQQLQAGAVQ